MTKKIDTTTIGGRIKKRRNDLGLSQEDLAEKLFTSKQMISSYENNKTELKVQIVKELAVALDTTSSFLIDGYEAVTYKEETVELQWHTVEQWGRLYIPIALHHVHGVLKPLSRKMRTTFTETVPLHDYC